MVESYTHKTPVGQELYGYDSMITGLYKYATIPLRPVLYKEYTMVTDCVRIRHPGCRCCTIMTARLQVLHEQDKTPWLSMLYNNDTMTIDDVRIWHPVYMCCTNMALWMSVLYEYGTPVTSVVQIRHNGYRHCKNATPLLPVL